MFVRRFKPLITLILLLAVICTLPIPAHAAYENTYKNTGKMRNDIIGVALTQVGYREGSNNYTKYGVWYGQPNSPWCCMFISWCANQAGVPTSIIRKNAIVSPSRFGLTYVSGDKYRPQKGDIFYTKSFSHAGLVQYSEGDYFYTVEGNTSTTSNNGNGVYVRKRKIADCYFSSPNYKDSGGKHQYKTGYETKHPHKEYQFCSHCGDKYYTGKTKTRDDCKTCIQANCKHQYGEWKKSSSSKHTKICTLCEKTVTESHEWKDGDILKEPNCKSTGKQENVCKVCNATKTVTLSKTDDHTYDTAKYLDETYHQLICSICKDKEKAKHITEGWGTNQEDHWKACTVCGEILQKEAHNFPDGCVSTCTTCEFVRAGTHQVGDIFAYDESGHWKICEKCGKATDNAEHEYISDCDENCQHCDYIRTPDVEHNSHICKDKTGHWTECDICNLVTQIETHTPDPEAEEWETQLCTYCDYELRSEDDHVHVYSIVQSDAQYHWGECMCGEVMPKAVHSWNVSTGTCRDCTAVYEPDLSDDSEFLIYVGSGIVLLVAIPLIVILLIKLIRKKRI